MLTKLDLTFFLWGSKSLFSLVWVYFYSDQSLNEGKTRPEMLRDAAALIVDQGPSRPWQPAHF